MCNICNGGGLIPFIKNGKVISNAWLECSCKGVEPERFRDIRPEDFDYPMSATFRSHTYQHTNQPDPGYVAPEPQALPSKAIYHYHVDISKQILRNLEGQVKYLQSKLAEKQVRKQTNPSGYKGIK